MSDCLHCDILDMLESRQGEEIDLAPDLILMAPPDDQGMQMADVLANLGGILLEKSQIHDPTNPRRSRH